MPRIFIDTNFFLLYLRKIDIFYELRMLVPGQIEFITSEGVIIELKTIKTHGTALILKIISQMQNIGKITVLPLKQNKIFYVDKWLLNYIEQLTTNEKTQFIVCTNDAVLRKKLKQNKIKVISLKNESVIDFV